MVLFPYRVRIQRVEIHKNNEVSTSAQYTFFRGPILLICYGKLANLYQ